FSLTEADLSSRLNGLPSGVTPSRALNLQMIFLTIPGCTIQVASRGAGLALNTNVLCEETNLTTTGEPCRPFAPQKRYARDRAGLGLSSAGLGKRSVPGATWGGRPAVDAYRCRSAGPWQFD